MADVVVKKINETYVKVECDEGIKAELNDFFSFFAHNYQFSPLYRKRIWNGKVYLYSRKKSQLYVGLIYHLREFCKDRKLTIEIDPSAQQFTPCTMDEVRAYAASLNLHSRGKPIEPHDYQALALFKAIKYHRILLLSPTASGKSLIAYLIVRYLLENGNKKGLLIVPNISLVEQMYGDFKDYSSVNGWDVVTNAQKIYQGHDKIVNKPLTISTWQSIYELPKSFFEQFDFVIGDEAHGFKAKSLTGIMTKLINAKYRIGTTGTIDDSIVNKLTLEGHFGPGVKLTTTKELIESGKLSDFEIKCLVLNYPDQIKKAVKVMEYQEEIDFIVRNEARNNFIRNLALDLKGNTLILFQFIDKHGKILYNKILEKAGPNRKVFFVYGGTEAEDREAVRRITEQEEDAIIVASKGVFSTGVNIRRLHNLINGSPSKSKVQNLQSIGRVLRLGEGKDKATLYDIVDDFRIDGYINYAMNHYAERIKIYHAEKFKVSTYKVAING